MANVGLERADGAAAAAIRRFAEGLGESAHLNGIANACAGAVRLDIRDAVSRHAGIIQRLGNDLGLAFNAGREIADLARAVIVDRGSEDDGVNVIVLGKRIFKAAQDHDAQAARKNRAA